MTASLVSDKVVRRASSSFVSDSRVSKVWSLRWNGCPSSRHQEGLWYDVTWVCSQRVGSPGRRA
eukprot:1696916-Alexandrium_andersonii.AAC.1